MYRSEIIVGIVPQRVPESFVRSTVTLKTEERLDAINLQVTSRTRLEPLIQELALYPRERNTLPLEDVVQLMRSSIDVGLETPRRGPRGPEPAHAFHVWFDYPDPVVAARVAQRLGLSFVDQNARDRDAMAKATSEFLEAQLAEARGRLEVLEGKVEAFRQQHGNELPTQAQSNLQALQNMQLQIQSLVESAARDRDRRLMLERIYNEVLSEPLVTAAAPSPGAPGTVTTATPQQQLALARQALAQMELRLKSEHPDVIRTKRAIANLEIQANAESAAQGTDVAAVVPAATLEEAQRRERLREMRAEMESLDRQLKFKESEEARIRSSVLEYQRRIEAVPGIESEWVVMTRDYESQQTAYKQLLARSEESNIALDLERRQIGEQFRILDPARIPVRPISPNRLRINGMGLGVGLVISLLLVGFLELRDATFRSEIDVTEVLSLPVLALLPYVETREERRKRIRRQWILTGAAGVAVVAAGYVLWTMRLWNHVV